jgi:hypothetical protein
MMSRDWLFTVARLGVANRGISGALGREGQGECCVYSKVSMWYPSSMSITDHTILAPMASLELCTN